MPDAQPEDDEDVGTVWLRTEPDLDGTYRVKLEISDDHGQFLDRQGALDWAEYVLGLAAVGDYESKVFRQLSQNASKEAAIQIIMDMRHDRVLPTSPTAMSFEHGLTIQGKSFLKVLIDGKLVGQWDLDQARKHAMHCIESVMYAQLDGEYRRVLVAQVGLEDAVARSAVDGLSRFE